MTGSEGGARTVLVLGATGYVGSRLVPALLAAGHEVVASSSRVPDPAAYEWGHAVEWRRCDATDPGQVARALEGVDALCYLVHSLDGPQFADRDRVAARTTAEAVAASDVRRVVYLSGLVPDPSGRPLSDHLASRHEVEGLLATSGRSTLALRAGVVIGAGSTSFEIVRQLATLLVVQPVPLWMHRQVQPVAVSDMVRALVEAVADEEPTGSLDVGGPDVLSYPALLAHVQPLRGTGAAAGAGADGPQHRGGAGDGRALGRAAPHGAGPGPEPARRHGLPPGPDLGARRRRPVARRRDGHPACAGGGPGRPRVAPLR